MDDATRLVSELHDKLAELDGKVAAYQRDMLAEFHRHMVECLEKYPENVSNEVSRVIAESMSTGRYPALTPGGRSTPGSPTTDPNAWDGRKSPPPVLRHTSGTPKEGPRSPHAREKEFHGLFTPSYLPLLENNDRPIHSPPMSPPPSAEGPFLALSTDNVQKVNEVKPAVAVSHEIESRPSPVRQLTGWSTSSIESSGSDSKAQRRSALRRSSSSVKGSPRRVRFEFEGEEVLPTAASPQASPTTPVLESGEEAQLEAEPLVLAATEDESTAYSGTSLLDVEGEEDFLPRPKKVSSTQALQALTRSPVEAGSVWTEVNADSEQPVQMNGGKQPASASGLGAKIGSQATVRAADYFNGPGNGHLGSPAEEPAKDDNEDEDASEDDFLSMRPKGKSPSPGATTPLAQPVEDPSATPKPTAPATNGLDDLDEADSLFDLDDEPGGPSTSHPPEKYLPELEDSDDEETATFRKLRAAAAAARDQAAAAASSAAKLPPVSPSAVLFGHSIGSYMGRSMTIAPIKDPKLYDEIAGMKDVHFFVGSIEDDPGSLRASSLRASAGFAPRSFTERLALEEEMERRRARGEVEDDEGY